MGPSPGERFAGFCLLGPAVMLLLWQILTQFELVPALFLPAPSAVFRHSASALLTHEFHADLGATLLRTLSGFAMGAVLGVPAGLLVGSSQRLYESVEVVVDFFRSLPATALFPLFMLFFGIGDIAKVSIAAFACFLTILVNTYSGVRNSKKERLRYAQTLRISGHQAFLKIVIWESLPQTIVGFRVAISLALVLVVVTEMFIGTTVGLGHRIIDDQLTYRVADLYFSILVAGLLGYCMNKIVVVWEGKFVHWSGK